MGRRDIDRSESKPTFTVTSLKVTEASPEFKIGDLVEILPFDAWADGTRTKNFENIGRLARVDSVATMQLGELSVVVVIDLRPYYGPIRALRLIETPRADDGWSKIDDVDVVMRWENGDYRVFFCTKEKYWRCTNMANGTFLSKSLGFTKEWHKDVTFDDWKNIKPVIERYALIARKVEETEPYEKDGWISRDEANSDTWLHCWVNRYSGVLVIKYIDGHWESASSIKYPSWSVLKAAIEAQICQ